MNFNKCERCGCFFVTDSNVCPKCEPKDNFEIGILKNYLNTKNKFDSIDTISSNTGIAKKNLDRYLQSEGLSNLLNTTDNNLKMNL